MPLQLLVPYYCWIQTCCVNKFFGVIFSSLHLQAWVLSFLHPSDIFELSLTSICTISLRSSSSFVVRYQQPIEYTTDSSPCLSWGTMVTMLMAQTKMTTPCCTHIFILMLRSPQAYTLVCSRYHWHLLQVPRLHLQLIIKYKLQVPPQLSSSMQLKWPSLMQLQVDFHCLQFCILFTRTLCRQLLILLSSRLMIDLRFDHYRQLSRNADWQFWHSDLPWLSSWLSRLSSWLR